MLINLQNVMQDGKDMIERAFANCVNTFFNGVESKLYAIFMAKDNLQILNVHQGTSKHNI